MVDTLSTPESHTAIEAEINVLGSALLDPEAFLDAREILTDTDFYSERNRIIWQHLERLHTSNQPLDMDLLSMALRDAGKLEDCGGIAYLLGLQNETMISVHARHYAQVVKNKSQLRNLELAGKKIILAARDTTDPTEALTKANQALNAVSGTANHTTNKNLMDGIADVYAANVERSQRKTSHGDIFTGLIDVDELLNGMRPGQLIVFAARPGMGKSVGGLQTAINAARQGSKTVIFSLEMYQHELLQRAAAMQTNISYSKIQRAQLEPDELKRMLALPNIPVVVDDRRGINADEIALTAQRLHRKEPLKFIVIDFLQRIAWRKGSTNEHTELGYMTKLFKDLAGNLGVPIMLLSQLNRSLEARPNRRPLLSDLRGSGSIEEDADTIIFPYREAYYTKDTNDFTAEWDIAKCRAGQTGKIDLRFFGAYQKFANGAK